eukprot:jgi/Galph1/3809/GphlegSOOS_G2483.1
MFYISHKKSANLALSACASKQQTEQAVETVEPSSVWELDFYSIPVYDTNNKRLWELIVVDENLSLCYIESVPNHCINSTELRKRIQNIIEKAPIKPTTIRFFRMQMYNMISIALADLGFEIKPSRRTYRLYRILKQRREEEYPKMPGFRSENVLFSKPYMYSTERLPDALRGEKFAFCSADYASLVALQKSSSVTFCDIFEEDISADTELPGLVIYSERAEALAGWTSGVEISFIKYNDKDQELVIECGINAHYRLAKLSSELLIEEAKSFETLKRAANGFHFYAIQHVDEKYDAIQVYGLWLLNDAADYA